MPKKLCVLSDGTWATPESPVPTNIVTLARAIKHHDPSGLQQLVFYDQGLATEGSRWDRFIGGYFGEGIDLNILQCYTFLSLNYEPGDQILLFGFSRGAYTVRSLEGLLRDAGLVTRENLTSVQEAYDLYRSRVGPDAAEAVSFRRDFSHEVPVRLLACFDSVGALGMPIPALSWMDGTRLQFHNTELADNVEHAIHILCLEEDRKAFMPTLMQPHSARGAAQLTQLYFPGDHSGVGGGSAAEVPLANNTLKFLVDEMDRRGIGLEVDMELIPKEYEIDVAPTPQRAFFSMHNVMKTVAGSFIRDVKSMDELHETAIERYRRVADWRPASLAPWKDAILGKK